MDKNSQLAEGQLGKVEKLEKEIELFNMNNTNVVSESNGKYIYILLDDKDKRLLMMMQLPHTRKMITKDGKLDAKLVSGLLDWNLARSTKHSLSRIKRLCAFGAIVNSGGIWYPNPKVVSHISQRA